MNVNFVPLASGSSGNCTYIGTENTKILIDVGISKNKIQTLLLDIDVDIKDIDAIFITHEHMDHIYGVGALSRKYNIPIYASLGTWSIMDNKIGEIFLDNKRYVYTNKDIIFKEFIITPFSVLHDAIQPVCYNIMIGSTKFSIVTDLGCVTRDVIENIRHSSVMLIESNHDEHLVKSSNYPAYIKDRILGDYGHISNEVCAKLLYCILNDNLKNVFIGHISEKNNTPDLVYITISSVLREFNIHLNRDLFIHILKPYGITKVVSINCAP